MTSALGTYRHQYEPQMSSKDLIFSGDSGPRASRPQGAPRSGVRPDSLVKKTLLPAVSRFYAHPPPFLTGGAIPRTIVLRVCLSEPPPSSPCVARSALHGNRSTMSIFSYCSGHFTVSSLHTTTRKTNTPRYTSEMYQRGTRAVPPVRASSCPQSTLVCDAAVFGTVLVNTIHNI